MKTCSKCQQAKPIEAFAIQRSSRDGRHAWCRVCHNAYIATRRQRRLILIDSMAPTLPLASALEPTSYRPVEKVSLNYTEAAYLAGIIDGEGSISLTISSDPTIYLMVTNTDAGLMRWLYERVGGNCSRQTRNWKGRKTLYRWIIGGHGAARVIRAVAPYLVIKHRLAELVETFVAARSRKDESATNRAIAEARALNGYGRRGSRAK